MASDHVWPVVGTVRASFGDVIEVARDPASGDVRIGLSGPSVAPDEDDPSAWMTPEQLSEFRELLDRAATPGQVTVAAFPCCKHCEADNAEYGTSCNPPRHLTRCASGCDDAASPSAEPAPGRRDMSKAEPMGDDRRQALYGPRMTPRQAVRFHHKRLRAQNDFEPVDVETPKAEQPKGRATPRQRKARRDG